VLPALPTGYLLKARLLCSRAGHPPTASTHLSPKAPITALM
jgi:hypothetical protein